MAQRKSEEPLPEMLTTSQIATRCGISPQSVLKRAAIRGITPALIAGRTKLWNKKAAERLSRSYGRGYDAVKMWQEIREGGDTTAPRRKAC